MRLTPEQQKLVEENHDLIYHMLNYHRLNHEDYYDIAAIGLCKAALIFKKPKKVQFSTFACHVINNEIVNEREYRNAKKRTGNVVSFWDPIQDANELTVGGSIRDINTPETIAFANDLLEALNGLTKRQQKAMRLSIQGYTYPEIGSIIGGSPKAISMLLSAARKKLRAEGYA